MHNSYDHGHDQLSQVSFQLLLGVNRDAATHRRRGGVDRKPDGFYTDKSGKVRPRHNPKGKGGAAAIAIGLVVVVGGVSAAGVEGASSLGGARARSATSTSRVTGQNSLRAVVRLQQKGFRVTSRLTSDDADCAAHSYGRVREFFRDHPCSALHRALFEALLTLLWVPVHDR
jgi:hypothetical protein